MPDYSGGFRSRMVQRMAGPEAISATQLAQEVGVPQPTLSRWLRDAAKVGSMKNKKNAKKAKTPQQRTGEEKIRIVQQAAELSEKELGAFLRKEGVHKAQLEQWRVAMIDALSAPAKKKRSKSSKETKRIRELEKDLRRKEKALAEVTALLALKKKLEAIWGDEDDGTRTRNGT